MFRIGLVGAGRVGKIRSEVIRGSEEAALVVVADTDLSQAQQVAQSTGAVVAEDWRAVVRRADVDIVLICTPTKFHEEIATEALAAGKHVLCEKPLARSVQEAERIVLAKQRLRKTLKTGFNYRHMAHVRDAKQLIDSGEVGRVYFLRCQYGHGGHPGYEKRWCTNVELSGGGVLLEQGIHILDLVRYLLGEPARIVAEVGRFFWDFPAAEDNCFCTIETAANQVAQIHVSWTNWINVFRLEIFGSDGYLRLEGRDGHYGPQRLVWGRRKADHSRPVEEVVEYGPEDDSWRLEWAEFLEAIRSGREPLGGAMDGLEAQKLVEAAYSSAREGRWVEVADVARFAGGR